jgi:hypothetical protein
MVDTPGLRAFVGCELLDEDSALGTEGSVQTVVVFGPEDDPKRSMLRNSGHTRGLEWFTKPFSA